MLVSFRTPSPQPVETGKSDSSERRPLLITGASGNIGSRLAPLLAEDYPLRLMVLDAREERAQRVADLGEMVEARLEDLDRMKEVCAGIDSVLHLAAVPCTDAPWERLLGSNIIGLYNTLAAAKAAGVRRVVLASSINAVSGYSKKRQVRSEDPVKPGNLYGVSKCFAESTARYMAEQEGLSCIALRIGFFKSPERLLARGKTSEADMWISPRDLYQMVRRCIEHPNLQFAVFNALSNNRFNRLDISDSREVLGYAPEDDAFALFEENGQAVRP